MKQQQKYFCQAFRGKENHNPETVRAQSLVKRLLKFTVQFHSTRGLSIQKLGFSLWGFSVKPESFPVCSPQNTLLYKLFAPTDLLSAPVRTA